MDFETQIKVAIYQATAETGQVPSLGAVAARAGATPAQVREACGKLRQNRVLFLEPDGETIRMAPPFSGVSTQHLAIIDGVRYYANCAWDALGIPAALHRPATIHSRCAQSREPLRLEVGPTGPAPSDWRFHCLVPAAHWWDDLVFT